MDQIITELEKETKLDKYYEQLKFNKKHILDKSNSISEIKAKLIIEKRKLSSTKSEEKIAEIKNCISKLNSELKKYSTELENHRSMKVNILDNIHVDNTRVDKTDV